MLLKNNYKNFNNKQLEDNQIEDNQTKINKLEKIENNKLEENQIMIKKKGGTMIIVRIKFRKSKKLSKNFLKTLAASLVVLNLFSSNFNSVKAVINEADVNEKTSKNSCKELIRNISQKITPKTLNIKQKETKNIIKLAGIGVSLIPAIYFVIKRYNKYTEDILSEENIRQENEARIKKIQEENEAQWKKNLQEYIARLKEIQQKDNTRRKKEVQLKENSKQWFETFETQYKEMVISFRENLNSDEKIKIFVNFCLEAIELERQYLEIFSMGLNLKNYIFLSGKVIVINTGATLNFNHENSDPLIDCDDDHKTAEKVLDDLKETFSAISIISSFLGIFNLLYIYETRDVSDNDFFIDLHIPWWQPVTGFKIINDKFVNCYYYHFGDIARTGLDVKKDEEFKNIFLLAYEKENILKCLNILEENLKNPFNVQKENILKLFTPYQKLTKEEKDI